MHNRDAFQPGRWLVILIAIGLAGLALLAACGRGQAAVLEPADGASQVPITAPIRLSFAQPMDQASVEARFHLEPEVAGQLVWQGQVATFQPRGALAPDTTYTASLEAGAVTERGRALDQGFSAQWHTRSVQLLYLGRVTPGDDQRQLFLAPLDGTPPRQLTTTALGVWDYAVQPQGQAIVYSVLRDDGGTDLWRMDRDGANQRLLLACPQAACLAPAWSPSGRQLAYERRDIFGGALNLDPKAGRIWLYDLDKGQERPLFDYDVPASAPVWSPGGDLLAYLSPLLPGVEVYDLRSGEFKQFGDEWGTAPTWAPDSRQLVLPDLLFIGGEDTAAPAEATVTPASPGEAESAPAEATATPVPDQAGATDEAGGDEEDEALAVRLIRIDLDSGQVLDISGDDDTVKDSAPAWSPGGGWIAVARQYLDQDRWTPGRQIWLTRPDASEAYALPAEPMLDHFAFAWRPDGVALAYLATDLSQGPQMVPDVSVWYFDFSLGQAVFVADDGVMPGWLP